MNVLNSFGAVDQYGRSRDFSLPDITGFGCIALFDSNGQFRRAGTWSWGDSVSWVRGAHTLKFGADFRRIYEDGFNGFTSRDTASFSGFTNFGVPFVNVNPNLPTSCDPRRNRQRFAGHGFHAVRGHGYRNAEPVL